MAKKYSISEKYLREQYLDKKQSQQQIADSVGCGSTLIWNLFHKFNIPVRPRSELRKGCTFSIAHRDRLSKAKKGKWSKETNPQWKGGISTSHTAIRKQSEYQGWRRRVLRFKGDRCEGCYKDLTKCCPVCDHKPDRHVHHIKDFSNNPSHRMSLSNSLVLCESCHKNQHKK